MTYRYSAEFIATAKKALPQCSTLHRYLNRHDFGDDSRVFIEGALKLIKCERLHSTQLLALLNSGDSTELRITLEREAAGERLISLWERGGSQERVAHAA